VALGAPWFVFVHRQVDTMVRAAWYRATATATAEARVESVELRLISGRYDGTQRVVPSVLLSFQPPEGAASPGAASADGRIRVRYLPHGEGLESFHQWATSPALLYSPPSVTPAWRFRWKAAGDAAPGFDLLWEDAETARLESRTSWNNETYLANALADLDRPIDLLIGDWLRDESDATSLPVRFRPSDPQRLFVADALAGLPPSGGNGFGELFGALVLVLPFGLPFWWVGTRLLSRGVAPRHRHYFVWVPLALLPFWGVRYLEVLERLSPGAIENNALLGKVGSSQVLPGAEPAGPGPSIDRRQRVDLASSRFAPTLALADLTRPQKRLGSADAAWRELETRFTAALSGLDDASLARTLDQTLVEEFTMGKPALAPILAEAARLATLEPARGETAKTAARQLLNFVLHSASVDLCHPSFLAYREGLERLAPHPEPEIARLARERLAEFDGWIEARERDWGHVC
jgi:hypothetical protein